MLEINKIYNMDCIEGMKLIPDGSIDCIITDPPYGTTACKRDTIIPFDKMREQLKRIIKPNGAIVLFGSEPFSSTLRISNIKQYKYDRIWEKNRATGHLNAKKIPMRNYENILVFYNKSPSYNPQLEEGKPYKKTPSKNTYSGYGKYDPIHQDNNGFRYPKSIIKQNSEQNEIHPTQKPVALIEYLVKTYTNEGETVLDFTIGSGTTAVACLNTNRNFIGFELDKGYREIANKRIGNLDNIQ